MLSAAQQVALSLVTQSGEAGAGDQWMVQMMPIALMVLIFWFIVLRPARKEREQHEAMRASLKRGDQVVTSAGILGTISGIEEGLFVIEVAKNTKVRVLKSSVARKYDPSAKKADKGEAKSS